MQKPIFIRNEPLRVFLPASRLTTVMQYVSKNLAKAFSKLGCEIKLVVEQNDMEKISLSQRLQDFFTFNPHIVVNINHANNTWLHPDVFNIIWYQDMMPDISTGKTIPWRDRDILFSLSPELDDILHSCNAKNIRRQHICFDEDVFHVYANNNRQNKAVFIGSSYSYKLPFGKDFGKVIVALTDALEEGRLIEPDLVKALTDKYDVPYKTIWPRVTAYIVRDTTVRWLCTNPHIDVEIYGRHWENDPIVKPFFRGELAHGHEVAKVYNGATYSLSALPLTINSQRLFELSACGCIPLVYDTREKADKPHWENECLYFNTKQALYDCLLKTPKGNPCKIAGSYKYSNFARSILDDILDKVGHQIT